MIRSPPETRRHSTLQKQLQCVFASRERPSDERNFCLLSGESVSEQTEQQSADFISQVSLPLSVNFTSHMTTHSVQNLHLLSFTTAQMDAGARLNAMSDLTVGVVMCICVCVCVCVWSYSTVCVHLCICRLV